MKKANVYIVDDDPTFAQILKHNFESQKVKKVKIFDSGEECLEQVGIDKPNLVMLDFMLGGLNGIDVLERIKTESPKTKVVIITALKDGRVRNKCLNRGAIDYILKDEEGLQKIRDEIIPTYGRTGFFSVLG